VSLRFGTDGVRGPAQDFGDPFVSALGEAAGRILGSGSVFLIGRDTRESSAAIERALTGGLQRAGLEVLSLGVVPTPAVAHAAKKRNAPAAMISASHNPWTDNGIKFFATGGHKLSKSSEKALEELLTEIMLGDVADPTDPIGDEGDVEKWCSWLQQTVSTAPQKPLRVILDCANGAATTVAPAIISALGVDVEVIGNEPNGKNINDGCGSTHPELLQQLVIERKADVGLALDGDADRLVAVDEKGQLVDGDQLIAMFAQDLMSRNALRGNQVVVTVMTNLGFRLKMAELGIDVIETPVGDRFVAEALRENNCSLGGEQSGHIIFADLASTGDGTLTSLQLLDLLQRSTQPLSQLAHSSMTKLPQVLVNVRVDRRIENISEVMSAEIRAAEAKLGTTGRILLRPSGTEPLIRVMVESQTLEMAQQIADELAASVATVSSA
jgi:phosphoglucosamine mutase